MNTTEDKEVQAQEPATPKRDYRQEVTNQIIEMLEKGTAPWQKPWEAGAAALPFNPTSDRGYRGGNALHLMATAARRGFTDPRWLTYRQSQENGWQVRQGEKGTQIEYWQFSDRRARAGAGETAPIPASGIPEESPAQRAPLHRVYTVFNAQQIDGIPPQNQSAYKTGRSLKPAKRFSRIPARRLPMINKTVHSTAARKTRFTCRQRKLSALRQIITGLLFMSWPTGPGTHRG
jgi:antirestriction protein ArdC